MSEIAREDAMTAADKIRALMAKNEGLAQAGARHPQGLIGMEPVGRQNAYRECLAIVEAEAAEREAKRLVLVPMKFLKLVAKLDGFKAGEEAREIIRTHKSAMISAAQEEINASD